MIGTGESLMFTRRAADSDGRSPAVVFPGGSRSGSQVPGGHLIACPASSKLRRTRGARPIRHQRCCLPTPDTGSASTKSDFGAIHTAYDLAVYASPLRLPPRRKTRFRLAATLGRTGLSPARSDRKVSETPLSSTDLRHLVPFPQTYPGARLAPLRCHHVGRISSPAAAFVPAPRAPGS